MQVFFMVLRYSLYKQIEQTAKGHVIQGFKNILYISLVKLVYMDLWLYICAIQTDKDMTNLTTTLKHRDLLLMINDVDEPNFNVFSVAKEMMQALKFRTITSEQYDSLCMELEYQCGKHNVSTENEFCSLF